MGDARNPDYILKAMDKITSEKQRIGAAWLEQDRSLTIKIDRFIVISGQHDAIIKLFPNDYAKPK